jgi:hypothetical protein
VIVRKAAEFRQVEFARRQPVAETARAIVESSLPSGLTLEQRRLAVVRRLYKNELPEAALTAHAGYGRSAAPT